MNGKQDHYNLDEVAASCAKHAWDTRPQELLDKGIASEEALRKEILRAVEDERTKAFRAQPQVERDDGKGRLEVPLSREIYALKPFNEKHPDHALVIVLNPNRDEHGKIHGGTCMIRKSEFERQVKVEQDITGDCPNTVTGGRPALRKQEQSLQLVDPQTRTLHSEPKPHMSFFQRIEQERLDKLKATPELAPTQTQEQKLERNIGLKL